MRILIADDDRITRRLLKSILRQMGHEVIETSDGAQAWEILLKESVSFVISDWMMPVMNGVELCRKIRDHHFDRYIYIIFLTVQNADNNLVEAMGAGADDYIVKPFNEGELNVRVRAGERILNLEKDLDERNQRLNKAYGLMMKDIEAAGKMQKNLLPNKKPIIQGVSLEWLFLPCTIFAGDIFNFFQLDEDHVGFYLLDVAGHGIQAAILSVTLSRMLTPISNQATPLKKFISTPPYYKIASPSEVVSELNDQLQTDPETIQYFTMVYGILDRKHQSITITQAGLPRPILLRRGESITRIGLGGYPVGMLPDLQYDEEEFPFEEGDRLVIYSDGIIESTNQDREMYSEERFIKELNKTKDLPLSEMIQNIRESLCIWRGGDKFDDDVSLAAIEYKS